MDLSIIKAYDVRGVVPEQLDGSFAYELGCAFAHVCCEGSDAVVIGRDMRASGPALAAEFGRGVRDQGIDSIDIGLASTDQLYFASGHLGKPGAMITASHNPAQYNGFKLCRAGAAPVGQDSGLREIAALIGAGGPVAAPAPGAARSTDVLAAYAAFLRDLVDLRGIRPLTIVVDAANGMAGHTAPAVLGSAAGLPALPVAMLEMYFELDGTFPNHEANPLEPANLVDVQNAVRRTGADVGLAFDGDADRCFVVDERGGVVSPSAMTALIAERELRREPGATVIHNLITSRTVPETIAAHGGAAVRTRVGHSFIKQSMAQTGAIFGGEHSGHFYFRDFWNADSGMLAALHILAALGSTDQPLSALIAGYQRYAASGEVNSVVHDHVQVTAAVRERYAGRPGVEVDDLDGLTVSGETWWFNLRPSNTEPLLRLNVEARTEADMAALRDDVLTTVRGVRP